MSLADTLILAISFYLISDQSCQVLEADCGAFGVIEAIKSPYGGRGFECVNWSSNFKVQLHPTITLVIASTSLLDDE